MIAIVNNSTMLFHYGAIKIRIKESFMGANAMLCNMYIDRIWHAHLECDAFIVTINIFICRFIIVISIYRNKVQNIPNLAITILQNIRHRYLSVVDWLVLVTD